MKLTFRIVLSLLVVMSSLSAAVFAIEPTGVDAGRIRIAARIMRAMLAADRNLAEKSHYGSLKILTVYSTARERALRFTEELQRCWDGTERGTINGHRIEIDMVRAMSVDSLAHRQPACIFIFEHLNDDELSRLIQFGIDRRIIVFSPFKGDVERGVCAGIAIDARVRPYVNIATITASKLSLKPFFLKVAKTYGHDSEPK